MEKHIIGRGLLAGALAVPEGTLQDRADGSHHSGLSAGRDVPDVANQLLGSVPDSSDRSAGEQRVLGCGAFRTIRRASSSSYLPDAFMSLRSVSPLPP